MDPIAYFNKELYPVVREHSACWGWKEGVELDELVPTYLNALSNMTYKVQLKGMEGEGNTVLVKRFGEGMLEKLLDRQVDNQVAKVMGEMKIGPKVLWANENARVEEFVIAEGFTEVDMADTIQRRKLMYYVQKIHRASCDYLPKGNIFERYLDDSFPLISLFKTAVEEKQSIYTEDEKAKVNEICSLVSPEEIQWLTEIHPKSDPVVSHNDFLNGNILKVSNDRFLLIDYEYSTYNPRTFDIANFMTESLFVYGLETDPYFEYNPSKRDGDEAIRDLIKFYLLYSKQLEDMDEDAAIQLAKNEEEADQKLLELFGDQDLMELQIKQITTEFDACVLLSHFHWILWGVMMSKNPNVKFNYIEFSYQRYKDYMDFKCRKFLSN